VEYEIVKTGTNERVLEFAEDLGAIENASATQVTIEKVLPLQDMEPGAYTLKLKVVDKNRNQILNHSASFTVTSEEGRVAALR
jgi:hypothetical protein